MVRSLLHPCLAARLGARDGNAMRENTQMSLGVQDG